MGHKHHIHHIHHTQRLTFKTVLLISTIVGICISAIAWYVRTNIVDMLSNYWWIIPLGFIITLFTHRRGSSLFWLGAISYITAIDCWRVTAITKNTLPGIPNIGLDLSNLTGRPSDLAIATTIGAAVCLFLSYKRWYSKW